MDVEHTFTTALPPPPLYSHQTATAIHTYDLIKMKKNVFAAAYHRKM